MRNEHAAHLLVVTQTLHKLLHRNGLLVGKQVPLCCQTASVDEDVGISCSR